MSISEDPIGKKIWVFCEVTLISTTKIKEMISYFLNKKRKSSIMQVLGTPLNPIILPQLPKKELPQEAPSVVESRKLCYDKIFEFLKEKGILDPAGHLNEAFATFSMPDLKQAQIERFNSIFSKTRLFIIENTSIEIKFTLEALFKFLNKDTIEVVGGTLFWILGSDYMKRVIAELHLPENLFDAHFFQELERPAADIDIRIPLEIPENPAHFTESVALFFQSQMATTHHEILKQRGFTKFYIQKDAATGEHFSIVAFKTEDGASFDILFIKKLARKHLFEHDGIKIEAHYFNRPFRTLHLGSNSGSILRSLLLKMTKILNATDIKNINVSGAYMLISYLAKGWRYHFKEMEETLLLKIFEETDSIKLKTALANHFPGHPFAPLIFCLYLAYFVPDSSQPIVEKIIEKLLSLQVELKPSLLQKIRECLEYGKSKKEGFLLINAYLQIFAHLLYMLKKEREELETDVVLTVINHSNCLQLKFRSSESPPLYFTMKESFIQSLDLFKILALHLSEELKVKLLPLFQSMMQFIEIDFKKPVLKEVELEEAKKWIFEYWESKEPLLHELGFYLLSCLGAKEKSSKYLPDLLKGLFSLLEKEPIATLRKNKFEAFLYYWQHSSEEELGKSLNEMHHFNACISKIDYNPKNLKKDFAFAFASLKNPALTGWILNVADSLDEDDLLEFAKKKIQSPEEGIKFLRRFLKDLKIENAKALFLFVLNHYLEPKNKILLDQDAEELASLATHFLKSLSPKEVMKETEKKAYLKLLQTLLSQDFMKGVTFQKLLEEKKICTREFSQVLEGTLANEKAALILKQHQHLPIDYRIAPPTILKERLALLLSCPLEQLTKTLYNQLRDELSTFLVQVVHQKKGLAQNFKSLLQQKVEWILLYLLESQENIVDYFKICKEFDPSIALKPALLLALIECLNKQGSKNQNLQTLLSIQDYFKSLETTSKKGSFKQLSLQQVDLYQLLAGLFLKSSDPESAFGYVQGLIHDMKAKKEHPTDAFMTLFDQCLELLLEKENNSLALTLVNMFEKTFETVKILNERKHWRALLLNFKEDQLRLSSFLFEKQVFFEGDQEIKEKVEITVKSLLSSPKINETLLTSALGLIKAYQLKVHGFIENGVLALKKIRNPTLIENTLIFFLDQQISILYFQPLFEFFTHEYQEIYFNLMKHFPFLIENLQRENPIKRQTFSLILMKGCLKILNESHSSHIEIHKAFYLASQEATALFPLPEREQVLIQLAFLKIYARSKQPIFTLLVWQHLQSVAETPEIRSYLKEFLTYFSAALEGDLKERLHDLDAVLANISNKIDASNFHLLVDIIKETSPYGLFNATTLFAEKIIQIFQVKNEEMPSSFKTVIEKLIVLLIKREERYITFPFINRLINTQVFTNEEVINYSILTVTYYFKTPRTIKDVNETYHALSCFLRILNNGSLKTIAPFIKKAVSHLIALGIDFDLGDEFTLLLIEFFQALFPKMSASPYYPLCIKSIPQENEYALTLVTNRGELTTEAISKEVRPICHAFLISLIEGISAAFCKKGVSFSANAEKILATNSSHLLLFYIFFCTQKLDLINALLNYNYASSYLSSNHMSKIIRQTIVNQIINLDEALLFFSQLNQPTMEAVFKLAICLKVPAVEKKLTLTDQTKGKLISELIEKHLSFNTIKGFTYACFIYQDHVQLLAKRAAALEARMMRFFKTKYPNETKSFHEIIQELTRQYGQRKFDYPEMPD